MNGRHPAVREMLESLPLDKVYLSDIVLGELAFGWENSAKPATTKRECLKCGKTFDSHGTHNRICIPCTSQNRAESKRQSTRTSHSKSKGKSDNESSY